MRRKLVGTGARYYRYGRCCSCSRDAHHHKGAEMARLVAERVQWRFDLYFGAAAAALAALSDDDRRACALGRSVLQHSARSND